MNSTQLKIKKVFAATKTAFVFSMVFLACSCSPLSAQVKFSQSAAGSVPVNQVLQLNITIENGNGNPKLGAMPDFQVVGGPFTSSNFSWINGNASQSVTYSYQLKPRQEGTFKIGKASVVVSGVTMESNELTVQVTKAAAPQQQAQQHDPFDPFDDPFFQQQQQQQPEISQEEVARQLKDDVFFRLEVNKSSAYEGEMLTATYKLYFKPGLGLNLTDISKVPAFEGFWSQEVELDPKRRPTTAMLNGRQYNTVDIFKYNLYPQRSGNLTVAAAQLGVAAQVQIRSKSRNVFDDFFNAGRVVQVPMTLKTTAGSVMVKSLPESGKPADFSGAVGKFNFETTISGKEGKTDDPITYSVKISGTGNLKLIEAPTLKLPPAFEVYEPKLKENITNGPAGLTGNKQYDFLIIPRQPGEYKIGGREFSYFDPSAGKYITVSSPEYNLKITGTASANPNAGTTATVSKQDVSLLGQDIAYIKTTTPVFEKEGKSFFGSVGFVSMFSTPFLLFIGLIAFKRRNETLAADVVGSKRRRALKLARKRLAIAEKHFKADNKKAFYDEVSRATWGYLGDKLNIDMAELSKDNVEEKLQARSVKPDTILKLKDLINTCELALYAPVSDEHGEMKKNYDAAMNLIADLEDEVKA